MLILNFSHPITADQRDQLATLLGTTPDVHDLRVQIDQAQPLADQIGAIVASAPLAADQWQTTPIIVNPPGYAPACAALLAELHGRVGHFPAIVRLRPVAGSTPVVYEVAEVVNLQAMREHARQCR